MARTSWKWDATTYDTGMMRVLDVPAILALSAPGGRRPRRPKTGFLERTVEIGGATHATRSTCRRASTRSSSWPVILFLHGAGESGTDGLQQTQVGLGPVLRTSPSVSPRWWCSPRRRAARSGSASRRGWPRPRSSRPSRSSTATRTASPSSGSRWAPTARGCWPPRSRAVRGHRLGRGRHRAARRGIRARLSALPPTLAADDPYAATAARVKGIPAWLFHGAEDGTVPVTESRRWSRR